LPFRLRPSAFRPFSLALWCLINPAGSIGVFLLQFFSMVSFLLLIEIDILFGLLPFGLSPFGLFLLLFGVFVNTAGSIGSFLLLLRCMGHSCYL
jgi:hypothetical protein